MLLAVHGKFILAVFCHGIRNQAVIGFLKLFDTLFLKGHFVYNISRPSHAAAFAGHAFDKVFWEFAYLQQHQRLTAFSCAVALAYIDAGMYALFHQRLFHSLGYAAGIGEVLGMDAAVLIFQKHMALR